MHFKPIVMVLKYIVFMLRISRIQNKFEVVGEMLSLCSPQSHDGLF